MDENNVMLSYCDQNTQENTKQEGPSWVGIIISTPQYKVSSLNMHDVKMDRNAKKCCHVTGWCSHSGRQSLAPCSADHTSSPKGGFYICIHPDV